MEPHLKDYEIMREDKLALVRKETKTAIYDNFFSARLVSTFKFDNLWQFFANFLNYFKNQPDS